MEKDAEITGADQAKSSFDFKNLLSLSVARWWWYVISLVVMLGLAAFYLVRTAPVYTRTTTILIKDDEETSNPLKKAMSSGFNVFKTNNMIQNEMLAMKSVSLMESVVKQLGINSGYYAKNGLRPVELYKQNPLSVTLIDSVAPSILFKFEADKNGHVKLWDFKKDNKKISGKAEGMVGQTIQTPVGKVMFSCTPWYSDKYIGKTITYFHSSPIVQAKQLVKQIKVSLGEEDANVINISYSNSSIAKADDLLNTLVAEYNKRWIADKNQVMMSTSNFINDRLNVLERELGEVDSDISSYKSENLLPDLKATSEMYLEQSSKNQAEMLLTNNQLYMANFLRQEMGKNGITVPLPANSGIDNSALEQQIQEYNTMVLERNRLIAASSESNPLVQDLGEALNSQHKNILVSLDNVITALTKQLRSYQSEISTATGHLAASPNQARYLLSVERQQKVKESLYLFLLERREENQLTQAFTAYNTRIIDPPFGEDYPTSPKTMLILFVAFMIGLLVPFGIIWLRETMNTRVRGKKDVESLTMPLMGEIPAIHDEHHKDKPVLKKKRENAGIKDLLVREGSRDIVNEAFRVLRTNLEFMSAKEKGCKVVMITSFNPGSGKSLITMNLAASLALKGKRVLVVDADLRRASASAFINNPHRGLADYLSETIEDYREVIRPLPEVKGVDVMPVGTMPPNPSELLGQERMAEMIEKLQPDYDYILLDCPPIDIVADTAVISKLATRTIFVIRAGLFERALLPELEKLYHTDRFNNMSLILNGVQTTSARYGSKYGYRYGYGYGNYGSYHTDK
ncbi:MAG: polysaccharide biosynthesis tyrosine autokinase [Muribaculaceae bacterium]|nr:polysaccharide biosynthesis tyrosine autokinase [Muribaculaceae bacterium]